MAEELENKNEVEETPQEEQSSNEDAEIVLDETESDKQVDFQKMTPAQKKKHIQEMKERKAKEKKVQEKAEKDAAKAAKRNKPASADDTTSEPSEPKKSKGKIILIVLIVLLIVGGAVAYLIKKKHSDHNQSNEKIVVVAPASDSMATEEKAQTVVAEPSETPATEEKAAKPAKTSAKTKTNAKPAEHAAPKTVAQAGKLQRPCWLVSYISVTSEKHAQKGVSELAAKGISGGYYWIPDYVTGGNQFFKVYAGPFASKDEASKALGSIQEINQQAYVLLLK